jgi:hypothetical protein
VLALITGMATSAVTLETWRRSAHCAYTAAMELMSTWIVSQEWLRLLAKRYAIFPLTGDIDNTETCQNGLITVRV